MKLIRVTRAQKAAAQLAIKRREARGEEVNSALRAIAEAQHVGIQRDLR